jgi:hypothetical protein
MNFPKIIPNTFQSPEVNTGTYDQILDGTVDVEFDGVVYTVPAKHIVGREITNAFGFVASGKNKKNYTCAVSYRSITDEHDCRVGGNKVIITKIWKE